MADLSWLRSSSVKMPSNMGSLSGSSASSVFNGSSENLFDLLQGRLGGSSGSMIFGTSSTDHGSSFLSQSDPNTDHDRDKDQETTDVTDSGSLLKTEDESQLQSTVEQMAMAMQPNAHLWPISDTSSSLLLGGVNTSHHQEILFNNLHNAPSLPPPTGLVLDSGQFPSLSSLKAHDPAPQLQALREFMSFGSSCTALGNGVPQHHPPPGGNLGGHGGSSMFLHLGDESCGPGSSSLLQLPVLPGQNTHTLVGENSSTINNSSKSASDMLAYRSLCQAELFSTERSPHRTQFQRENHILAERQRREEMNEKFSALRAMIPKATKKDKASIVGDTIGYVLELQKTLKQLQACKATRKGSSKLLKKKPSNLLKMASSSNAATATTETTTTTATIAVVAAGDDCERSIMVTDIYPADLDSSNVAPSGGTTDPPAGDQKKINAVGSGSGTGICTTGHPEVFSHHHLYDHSADDREKQEKDDPDEMDIFDDPMISGSSAAEDVHASADSFEHKMKDEEVFDILPGGGGVCDSEIDVQNLGEQQAVIKIVCARSSGLVLRILLALDECKVDVLQSNVTTVAEKSVHFITVQLMPLGEVTTSTVKVETHLQLWKGHSDMGFKFATRRTETISSGLSSTTEEMIAVLLKASSATNSNGKL